MAADPAESSFDDPALKAALRRAIGTGDRAPDALRDRVRALLAAGAGPAPAPAAPAMRLAPAAPDAADAHKPIPLFRRAWARYAAAAVFLVAAGTALYVQLGPGQGGKVQYVIPNSLLKAMVATHQSRAADQAGPDSITTLVDARALAAELKRPVLAADLTRDGWTFRGGAIRTIGNSKAAQLFFTKGAGAISVVSLPASAVPQAQDGFSYETQFNGVPVAGATRMPGLFCILGTSTDDSVSPETIKSLFAAHRNEIVKS